MNPASPTGAFLRHRLPRPSGEMRWPTSVRLASWSGWLQLAGRAFFGRGRPVVLAQQEWLGRNTLDRLRRRRYYVSIL